MVVGVGYWLWLDLFLVPLLVPGVVGVDLSMCLIVLLFWVCCCWGVGYVGAWFFWFVVVVGVCWLLEFVVKVWFILVLLVSIAVAENGCCSVCSWSVVCALSCLFLWSCDQVYGCRCCWEAFRSLIVWMGVVGGLWSAEVSGGDMWRVLVPGWVWLL